MRSRAGLPDRLTSLIRENVWRYLLGFIAIAAFIALWAFISWYLQDTGSEKAIFIPSPSKVADAFFDSFRLLPGLEGVTMWNLIASSMGRVLLGYLIALVIAFPAGLLMGNYWTADALGRPIVEMFRPIPPLAWVPVFVFVFGALWGPVGIVFLGAFFPILINVMFGVKSVDPSLVDAAKTLGARRRDVFVKVVMPTTIPYLMTGLKVGIGISWMCIVAAEAIGLRGGAGLGYYISLSSLQFGLWPLTYATMIVIGILSMVTTGLASLLEQRFYRWSGMK
jgi:ABC-type nitrate/sulfonate/bicarbonate transport system permease component